MTEGTKTAKPVADYPPPKVTSERWKGPDTLNWPLKTKGKSWQAENHIFCSKLYSEQRANSWKKSG